MLALGPSLDLAVIIHTRAGQGVGTLGQVVFDTEKRARELPVYLMCYIYNFQLSVTRAYQL